MSYYTQRFKFTRTSFRATRHGKCPTCGKRVTRSRTFEQTVNPFNKNEDGSVKTWAEVSADVRREAAAWDPQPSVFEHNKCYDERTNNGEVAS